MTGMSDTIPHEYWRWELVQDTGWTLEQVDALSVADYWNWMQIRDGKAKARGFMNKSKNRSR